jgi:hypothetical protein
MNNYRYVSVELYYEDYERNRGVGYCPLTEPHDSTVVPAQETFYLDSNGCWHQQTIYDLNYNGIDKIFASKIPGLDEYAAIKSLDGDCGIKLLAILNNQIKEAQLRLGFTNILQGDKIFNNMGKQLYPKNR